MSQLVGRKTRLSGMHNLCAHITVSVGGNYQNMTASKYLLLHKRLYFHVEERCNHGMYYTFKNTADLLQVVNFTGLF